MDALTLALVTLVAGAIVSVGLGYAVDVWASRRRAGKESSGYKNLDLSGEWHAIWESTIRGEICINSETVVMRQRHNRLDLKNTTRSSENPEGGYLWRGELTVWDNQHLLGYYVAREPNVISKGTFYYAMHPTGDLLEGRWVGCSFDGKLISGFAVMSRDANKADHAMQALLASHSRRRRVSQ